MQNETFYPNEFITSNVMNQQVANEVSNFQQILLGRGSPGLIAPTAVNYTINGLTVNLVCPLPFQVLFGTGILASAHGTVYGSDTNTYTVSFSGMVPATGQPAVTAYLAVNTVQIYQTPVIFTGPPPGHPDFNPNYQPATFYTQTLDSLNIFATTNSPDNQSTFELFRCNLSPGSVSLTGLTYGYQVWSSAIEDMPITQWAQPGTLVPQTMNRIMVGGAYHLPDPNLYNSNLIGIVCEATTLVNIDCPAPIYGWYGQAGNPVYLFPLANGGSIDLEAVNGSWKIVGGNATGWGVVPPTYPYTVPQGGTGRITLPAHTVLLGEDANPIGFAGPGGPGMPLIGQGNADPVFGAVNLNSTAVTNVLQIANGGTSQNFYTPFSTICLNSNSGQLWGVGPGATWQPLVSAGGSSLPSYQPLNLWASGSAVQGVLQLGYGGTANNAYTPWSTIIYHAGSGILWGVNPGAPGQVLTSNGAGTAPSYQGGSGGSGSPVNGRLINIQVLTGNGTYWATPGTATIFVHGCSGGAGGGGTTPGYTSNGIPTVAAAGGGGAGGEFGWYGPASYLSGTAFSCGPGGAGGYNGEGGVGGTTTFGFLYAYGAHPGYQGGSFLNVRFEVGGWGGIAGGGNIFNKTGQPGQKSSSYNYDNSIAGIGASSSFGGCPGVAYSQPSSYPQMNGYNGGPGAGGGGAYSNGWQGLATGGSGGDGMIVVWEYSG